MVPSTLDALYSNISAARPCALTRGLENTVSLARVLPNAGFWGNEAVGCRVGLMVVNDDPAESSPSTCAVVTGITAWRNAHMGVGGVDAVANTLVAGVVVAENHIGISFSYFRSDAAVFSGVSDSLVIGSLSQQACSEGDPAATGSTWATQKCQVFSHPDPFGLSRACQSVLAQGAYTRVGVLIPQSTSIPKTCKLAGRFQPGTCAPSLTIDRLCALPYEKRYALPMGEMYVEHHLFRTTFTGFSGSAACGAVRGAALGINPSQIDEQPTVVSSALTWAGEDAGLMDMNARLGLSISDDWACSSSDCNGQQLLLIHDYRGFLLGTADAAIPDAAARGNVSGQVVFNFPNLVDESCVAAASLGPDIYSCLAADGFRQYDGLWEDKQDQGDKNVVGPIVVSRYPGYAAGAARAYSSYSGKFDPCPDQLPTNRFQLLLAAGHYHKLHSAGPMPVSWVLRWDAPSAADSAVVDIALLQPYVVDVYVGSAMEGPFTLVAPQDGAPTYSDAAGANAINPRARNVTAVLRGGALNHYMFVITPTISVTVRMAMSLADFIGATFVANVATLLGIDASRVKIADVRSGSVVVDFTIAAARSNATSNSTSGGNSTSAASGANSTQVYNAQVVALQTLASNLTASSLAGALNVTVLNFTSVLPQVVVNGSISTTFGPTSAPSAVGTQLPTRRPSAAPSTATPPSTSDTSPLLSPQNTLIIAVTVGAGVLFMLLGAAYYCCVLRRQNTKINAGRSTACLSIYPRLSSNRTPAKSLVSKYLRGPADIICYVESILIYFVK